MANPKFSDISGYGWNFLQDKGNIKSSMFPIPINFIEGLQIAHRGQFGEFVVKRMCQSAGLSAESYSGKGKKKPYSLLINGHRVKVKIAFESSKKTWTFNQIIYPGNYDYLCCLGVFPDSKGGIDGKGLVFHDKEIEYMINTGGFSFQHHGKQTWTWKIPSRDLPDYYNGKGTLDEIIEIFSKTSNGKHGSEWGKILSLESD